MAEEAKCSDLQRRADKAFLAGRHTEAIGLYTRALKHPDVSATDYQHLLFSNRSACHYRTGDFLMAAQDAANCVEIEPMHAAGYSRLGMSMLSMPRPEYQAATDSFEAALALEPENAAARKAISMIRAMLDRDLAAVKGKPPTPKKSGAANASTAQDTPKKKAASKQRHHSADTDLVPTKVPATKQSQSDSPKMTAQWLSPWQGKEKKDSRTEKENEPQTLGEDAESSAPTPKHEKKSGELLGSKTRPAAVLNEGINCARVFAYGLEGSGGMRGLVATAPIEKGSLLLRCPAFATTTTSTEASPEASSAELQELAAIIRAGPQSHAGLAMRVLFRVTRLESARLDAFANSTTAKMDNGSRDGDVEAVFKLYPSVTEARILAKEQSQAAGRQAWSTGQKGDDELGLPTAFLGAGIEEIVLELSQKLHQKYIRAAALVPSTQGKGKAQGFAVSLAPAPSKTDLIRVCWIVRHNFHALGVRTLGARQQHQQQAAAGWGVFPVASLINHSCYPNSALRTSLGACPLHGEEEDETEGDTCTCLETMYVRASRDINVGEEVTLCYLPRCLSADKKKRGEDLKKIWGFSCRCERCMHPNFKGSDSLLEALMCPRSKGTGKGKDACAGWMFRVPVLGAASNSATPKQHRDVWRCTGEECEEVMEEAEVEGVLARLRSEMQIGQRALSSGDLTQALTVWKRIQTNAARDLVSPFHSFFPPVHSALTQIGFAEGDFSAAEQSASLAWNALKPLLPPNNASVAVSLLLTLALCQTGNRKKQLALIADAFDRHNTCYGGGWSLFEERNTSFLVQCRASETDVLESLSPQLDTSSSSSSSSSSSPSPSSSPFSSSSSLSPSFSSDFEELFHLCAPRRPEETKKETEEVKERKSLRLQQLMTMALSKKEKKGTFQLARVEAGKKIFETAGALVVRGAHVASFIRTAFEECDVMVKTLVAKAQEEQLTQRLNVGDGFAEIINRCKNRFDMKVSNIKSMFEREPPPYMPLVQAILGPKARLLFAGVVFAYPDKTTTPVNQRWHTDGGALFRHNDLDNGPSSRREYRGYHPCYCLNVFIPLVDMTQALGPTQFAPGSHRQHDFASSSSSASSSPSPSDNPEANSATRKTERKPAGQMYTQHLHVSPLCAAGDVTIADYRVSHRGLANVADKVRPVLYLTYACNWYADVHNFSTLSLLEGSEAELEAARQGEAQRLQRARAQAKIVARNRHANLTSTLD